VRASGLLISGIAIEQCIRATNRKTAHPPNDQLICEYDVGRRKYCKKNFAKNSVPKTPLLARRGKILAPGRGGELAISTRAGIYLTGTAILISRTSSRRGGSLLPSALSGRECRSWVRIKLNKSRLAPLQVAALYFDWNYLKSG